MKVYVLDDVSTNDTGFSTSIIGAYVSPRVARKHLDEYLGHSTKGMWNKEFEGSRYLVIGDTTYTITEFEVVKK